MYGEYHNIRIAGIQAAVPSRTVDNKDFTERVGSRRAKKFIEYTGIDRRHLCGEGQRASDLAAYAADRLLDSLGWDRNDIRVLVNITQSADLRTPATAMIIQKRLGIGTNCLAFDVNLGCSAYPSGLQIVAALLQNTGGKAILTVGDGSYSPIPETPDMDSLLFGDGAAATAIEISDGYDMYYSQYTDGSRYELLYSPWSGGIVMDGNAIMLMSLNEASRCICDLKRHFDIPEESIDYYVFHQAQKLIIDGVVEECKVNPDKALRSYGEYGNTSTATLPVTISHHAQLLKMKSRIRLLLAGFGVGLTWNAMVLNVDTADIYPVLETDYAYMDQPGV